jgi:hypothetical protein
MKTMKIILVVLFAAFSFKTGKATSVNMILSQATKNDTTFVNIGDTIVVHRHFLSTAPAQFLNSYYNSINNKIFQLTTDYVDTDVRIHTVSDSVANIILLGGMGIIQGIGGITYGAYFYFEANAYTTGIQEEPVVDNFGVNIFPNPALAYSSTYITFDKQNTSDINIKIFALNGKLINGISIIVDNLNDTYKLDLTNVPAGTYIIQIMRRGRSVDRKLVIL